jgi:pimeloyl-ACP methyl ester carboxylesterase
LLGIHVNFPQTLPPDIVKALQCGDPPPSGLSADERRAYEQVSNLWKTGIGYGIMMGTRPQTLYGLVDSPVGLAAWIYDKFAAWTYTGGHPERELTRDEMLDNISLYWLTNTAISSARLYWENKAVVLAAVNVSIPAAVSVFPGENYQTPRSWAERAYHKLIYYHALDKGGHFAAWEQPQLFSEEVRAGFRPVRK